VKQARASRAPVVYGALMIVLAGLVALGAEAGAASAAAPGIRIMTVFRSGAASSRTVGLRGVRVRVGHKRCAVPARSALAALVRSRPGPLGLKDYASCSRRAADAGGLYVRSIRGDRGRGQNGWVYKVGHKLANAGAGDPAGPFGRGRLRNGQRVTWFYCLYRRGCQRTLELSARAQGGGAVSVRVRGYDDAGKGVLVSGAKVSGGGRSALTDASGTARLVLAPGPRVIRASKSGLVRSFGERVTVRG
jgi:hypothetical protein